MATSDGCAKMGSKDAINDGGPRQPTSGFAFLSEKLAYEILDAVAVACIDPTIFWIPGGVVPSGESHALSINFVTEFGSVYVVVDGNEKVWLVLHSLRDGQSSVYGIPSSIDTARVDEMCVCLLGGFEPTVKRTLYLQ